ncbi:MAG: gliding motility-associated C-terminal domain-containing protein [Chitinophagales bacterium]
MRTNKRWGVLVLVIIYWALSDQQFVLAQNLVPNASFETYNTLPLAVGQWQYVEDWMNVNNTFPPEAIGSLPTPDYFHINGSGNVQLPNTIVATVNPFHGSAVMGLTTYDTFNGLENREYITVPLTEELWENNFYRVSFYATSGETYGLYNGIATNGLGVYFSNDTLLQTGVDPLGVEAHAKLDTILYTNDWQKISFDVFVTDTYSYLTIGNFLPDNETEIAFLNEMAVSAYYFIDSVEVKWIPAPLVANNTTICVGDEATLTATGGNGVYEWFSLNDTDTPIGTEENLTLSPITTTTYLLSSNEVERLVTITVLDEPTVFLSDLGTVCDTLMPILTPIYGEDIGSIFWQDSSTDSTYTVSETGTYTVSVANECGSDFASSFVEFEDCPDDGGGGMEPDIVISSAVTICQGESTTLTASGGTGMYQWFPLADPANVLSTQATVTVSPSATTNYVVMSGFITKSVPVYVIEPPVVLLSNLTAPCDTQTYTLSPTLFGEVDSIVWQNGSNESTFTPTESGTYSVTAYNSCGETTATNVVTFLPCDTDTSNNSNPIDTTIVIPPDTTVNPIDPVPMGEDCQIVVPTAFSPNRDNINDMFTAQLTCASWQNYHLQVFNRWGQLVFETYTLNQEWNGQQRFFDSPIGVYLWQVSLTQNDGTNIMERGQVTLLR